MKMTVLLPPAGLALWCLVSPLAASAIDVFDDPTPLETYLHAGIHQPDAGMVVGLVDRSGSRVFSGGTTGNAPGQRPDGDTLFEIGSVTKTFTSLVAMDMNREGTWNLGDPVEKHLPAGVRVPSFQGKPITLRHLAAQDSGLPFNVDNFAFPRAEWWKSYDAYTADDLYAFLGTFELTNAPGARFEYSNAGMSLLGHAMERASGFSFESLVIDHICRPLRMDSTRVTLTTELKDRMAVGHDQDGKPVPNLNLQVMAGAGALKSSANDLLHYVSAQLGLASSQLTPLIKESHVIRHTGAPVFGRSAMPWVDGDAYTPPGSDFLGHAGGTHGFSAFVGFDLKKKRGVVVLTNQRITPAAAVGWLVLQELPVTRENLSMPVREVVGIGTALGTDETTGVVRITRVFPESPAGKAGLVAGLVIRSINGRSVEGRSPRECLEMMGGPIGTKVTLELLDPEGKHARSVELAREKFVTSS